MKRNLYLTTIPVEEAGNLYMEALGDSVQPRAEKIRVIDALGRITSEAIYARYSSPLYNSAAMDGIAVISLKTAGASEASPVTLKAETDYMVVDTGDPVKKPYDAVIMAEDTQETEGGMIIRAAAPAWQHVRPVGEDIVEGEMILTRCHRIRPIDIGVLLSGGVTEISVFAQPKVGIIPTGTEIVEPYEDPKEGDIIESNSRMFEAMVSEQGSIPHRYDIVPDDYDARRERHGDRERRVQRGNRRLYCTHPERNRRSIRTRCCYETGQAGNTRKGMRKTCHRHTGISCFRLSCYGELRISCAEKLHGIKSAGKQGHQSCSLQKTRFFTQTQGICPRQSRTRRGQICMRSAGKRRGSGNEHGKSRRILRDTSGS